MVDISFLPFFVFFFPCGFPSWSFLETQQLLFLSPKVLIADDALVAQARQPFQLLKTWPLRSRWRGHRFHQSSDFA